MSEISFLELGTVNAPYKEALKAAAARVIDSGRYVGGAENEALGVSLRSTHRHALCGAGVSTALDGLRLIFARHISGWDASKKAMP